jgi:hypothetical protein
LVDADGIVNPEGFYNHLTGWFHIDNMMYYVSQAAFFPTPPPWAFNPKASTSNRLNIDNFLGRWTDSTCSATFVQSDSFLLNWFNRYASNS